MSKLVICIGSSGSGKTTYADKLIKEEGFGFISFDDNCDYTKRGSEDINDFIHYGDIEMILKAEPDRNFVLDGYSLNYDYDFEHIKASANGREIEVHHIFCDSHIVVKRQVRGKARVHNSRFLSEQNIGIYNKLKNSSLKFKYIYSKDGFIEKTKGEAYEMLKLKTKEELVNGFLKRLHTLGHDKYYQDIEVNNKKILKGYSESSKTWEGLKDLIEWRCKTVCDLGCFHGYFCLKAVKEGAICSGVDKSDYVLDVAREVLELNDVGCELICHDMQEPFNRDFDVFLILNMLHHVKKPEVALDSIFSNCREAIFEVNHPQKDLISEFANKYGFKLIKTSSSHRSNRIILVYEKE